MWRAILATIKAFFVIGIDMPDCLETEIGELSYDELELLQLGLGEFANDTLDLFTPFDLRYLSLLMVVIAKTKDLANPSFS